MLRSFPVPESSVDGNVSKWALSPLLKGNHNDHLRNISILP